MKAILLTGLGGTDMLRYGNAPDPVAGSGDVVIDVYAASVNAADSKMRRGLYGDLTYPHILGRDFSGVVSAVGAGATISRSATQCSASRCEESRARMPKSSRSRRRSSPRNRNRSATSRRRAWG